MNLYELKTRNVLELKSGDFILVQAKHFLWNEYFHLKGEHKHDFCNSGLVIYWKSNLKHLENSDFDVVKVYEDFTLQKVLWERKPEVLTEEEQNYLRNLIKPFRNQFRGLEKQHSEETDTYYLVLDVVHCKDKDTDDSVYMPNFEKDSAYKGLKTDKYYTLDELGL